jgi:AraC-like DNA-binding protein
LGPLPGEVPIERTAFDSRDIEAVQDLIRRRYVAIRPRVVRDDRDGRFRSRSAWAAGLGVDHLDFRACMEFSTDPFPSVAVMSLAGGRYAVGGGRDRRNVSRGESVLWWPGTSRVVHLDRITSHVVQLPAAVLARTVRRLGMEPADLRFDATAPVSSAMNQHWRTTAAYLDRLFTGPQPALAYPLVMAAALEAAAAAVLTVFPNTTMTTPYTAGPGRVPPATVRRAVAFIDTHAADPITLDDIATAAGIGVRGLQSGFACHRDCSPMAYLRRVRMEGAHRDLQAGDRLHGDTVAGIARRWGFATPGRFAVDYRRAYGRSPSRTLRV